MIAVEHLKVNNLGSAEELFGGMKIDKCPLCSEPPIVISVDMKGNDGEVQSVRQIKCEKCCLSSEAWSENALSCVKSWHERVMNERRRLGYSSHHGGMPQKVDPKTGKTMYRLTSDIMAMYGCKYCNDIKMYSRSSGAHYCEHAVCPYASQFEGCDRTYEEMCKDDSIIEQMMKGLGERIGKRRR